MLIPICTFIQFLLLSRNDMIAFVCTCISRSLLIIRKQVISCFFQFTNELHSVCVPRSNIHTGRDHMSKIGRLDSRIDRSRFQHTRFDRLAITVRCVHARVTERVPVRRGDFQKLSAELQEGLGSRALYANSRPTRACLRVRARDATERTVPISILASHRFIFHRYITVAPCRQLRHRHCVGLTTRCLTLIGTQINLACETATRTHNLHRMQIATFRRDATRFGRIVGMTRGMKLEAEMRSYFYF